MRFVIALLVIASVFAECPADPSLGCVPSGNKCVTSTTCPQYTEGHKEGEKLTYICMNNKWEKQNCVQLKPENFKYPTSDIEMLKDKPMTPITPTIECYQCVFKVKDISIKEPAVFPAGINFQTADGTISGTPTEEKEKTEYTIIARAEDAGFDVEFKLTMMVTTEKANYTLIILIVICVVVLVAIFGTCLFCRIRGTGRNTRKARQLKTAGGAKQTTNRV